MEPEPHRGSPYSQAYLGNTSVRPTTSSLDQWSRIRGLKFLDCDVFVRRFQAFKQREPTSIDNDHYRKEDNGDGLKLMYDQASDGSTGRICLDERIGQSAMLNKVAMQAR